MEDEANRLEMTTEALNQDLRELLSTRDGLAKKCQEARLIIDSAKKYLDQLASDTSLLKEEYFSLR